MEDIAVRGRHPPTDRRLEYAELKLSAVEEFPDTMAAILEEHRPSRMPFFGRLAALPRTAASAPGFLGQIHLVYQSAMHATRAAVYHLPHLDSPALRKRKLQIFIDDDGLPDGDTHHYQLTRAFLSIGAKCLLAEALDGVWTHLDRIVQSAAARVSPRSSVTAERSRATRILARHAREPRRHTVYSREITCS